jgi:hypothetical protein
MTMQPQPSVMTALAKHRGAELRTRAERHRLATFALAGSGQRRPSLPNGIAVFAIALAQAALAAVGRAADADDPIQLSHTRSRAGTQVAALQLAAGGAEASAARTAPAAS